MPLKLMYIPYQEAFIRIIDDYKYAYEIPSEMAKKLVLNVLSS